MDKLELKPFQRVGVDFMKSRKTALLADDMGLGKTIQAAVLIKELCTHRVLILTLASLKINWARELETWVGEGLNTQIVRKVSDKIDDKAHIIICNYDLIIHKEIKKQLCALDYSVVIMDEAHVLSNADTKRTKAVLGQYGIIHKAHRVYALTGTPVRNRPKDFYILLKVLAPECIAPYTSYESYVMRYCAGYYDSYGVLQDKGASNIEELAERIKPFMLRRTKEDVLSELPPLVERTVELELTPEIAGVLKEEEDMSSSNNSLYEPNEELGIQAKTRRLLGLAKVPQVIKYIKDVLETQEKVVVFAYHRDVIDELRVALKGYGVRVVAGGLNANTKQMEVDLFIKDPYSRIFIGQYTAAGFGVDGLQKAASNVIFAEIEWVPGNIEQARDRIRRIGQTNPVVAHYLIVPNTLEDNMSHTVKNKKRVINKLIQSSSGATRQIVEHRKNEKEENMTIESTLEDIAKLLKEIHEHNVNSTDLLVKAICALEPTKGTATKAKKAKKAEPVISVPVAVPQNAVAKEPVEAKKPVENVEDFLAELDIAEKAEPAKVYTEDDTRTETSHALARLSKTMEQAVACDEIRKVFRTFGIAKLPELKPEQYADYITAIKKLGV